MPNLDFAQERVDLACAFRWTARLGMHEGIANHFSLAVSDDGARFLINPSGRHFSRIRARDLVLIDADDPATIQRADAPSPTAWALHGMLHRSAAYARCVLHVHSHYATALASLADSSLPPIDQVSMRFYERVVIDEGYDGMVLGEEAARVCRLVEDESILLMGNHGFMVVAATVADAFDQLYYFERACRTYITALSTGRRLREVSPEVARKTRRQWLDSPGDAKVHFRELKAILDDEEPAYRE